MIVMPIFPLIVTGLKYLLLKRVCLQKKETDSEVCFKHFTSNPDLKISSIDVEDKYRHKTLKTSWDYQEDYEFIKCVFAEFHHLGTCFLMLNIIDLVKNRPDILSINANTNLTRRSLHHIQSIQEVS